ncbi:hypothetical protein A1O1_07848 [Capronia coronata CBS 617.96]|uniref:Uncharacterized protein n=1 Tax=Capronia coronata CBS 617.96 TaxID=1182541 RepID=W9XNH1_9EURO|nr:uncharacterized protein A1O1_07848 [Capronia coronata CBS 617.96]EXJ81783.1 hypothetical protein A1O1_07848 [Capronia coronata CBS 617.96]
MEEAGGGHYFVQEEPWQCKLEPSLPWEEVEAYKMQEYGILVMGDHCAHRRDYQFPRNLLN